MNITLDLDEHGWGKVLISCGKNRIEFQASELGGCILDVLFVAIMELEKFYSDPDFKLDSPVGAVWYGEPSGLELIFWPQENFQMRAAVWMVDDMDSDSPNKDKVFECTLTLEELRAIVQQESIGLLKKHGLRGFHEKWNQFPISHFLQFHYPDKNFAGSSWQEDLEDIRRLLEDH